MNTNNVKKYAPKARKAFIEAMSKQAAKYGITKNKIEPAEQKGDLVLIGDRPFPASVIKPRERLVKRIEQQGFDQVMEHVAYSWFNRLCAIRYMERKGFLDHGRRVLSAADGSAGVPQILEECLDVELPGLDQAKVRELKLDGTKDEELYRELLLAQCHALHQAMPFLFEAVADESELLLPENLTKTDSLIRDLVASVPDEDWDHIEIIGWLYQFYISEKKDQVIGKVVKSEDIPAATQLFTPNWIVQYLVQNSVGRHWLQTYPDSPLKEKMPYYIEPPEQSPEVMSKIADITPSEVSPESLKIADIACGSGHILVETYRVMKAIYEERGYRSRDIPQLILENNLFGLDIDDRAGQMAGFALLMLAREDDRRIFSRNIRLNILSLQESANVNLPSLWRSLNLTGEWQSGASQGLFEEEQQDLSSFAADNRYQLIQRTLERFKKAKTFGSLIDVSHDDYEELKELFQTLCELEIAGDSMQKAAASQLIPFVHQSIVLSQKYESVLANPPYMGSAYYNSTLKDFASLKFDEWGGDLFTCFIKQSLDMIAREGSVALITIGTWTFLPTFEAMRRQLLDCCIFTSIIDNGRGVWGSDHGSLMFSAKKIDGDLCGNKVATKYLSRGKGKVQQVNVIRSKYLSDKPLYIEQDLFKKIPGYVISVGATPELLNQFLESHRLRDLADARQGIKTGDIAKYLRYWHEVSYSNIKFDCNSSDESMVASEQWYPCNKGGEFRKWYGNQDYVLNWKSDGFEIRNFKDESGKLRSRPQNTHLFFKEGITWSTVTMGRPSFRYSKPGRIFESGGSTIFTNEDIYYLLGVLNSKLGEVSVGILSPKVSLGEGAVSKFPIPDLSSDKKDKISECAKTLVQIFSTIDSWDESTFDFTGLFDFPSQDNLEVYATRWIEKYKSILNDIKRQEDLINSIVLGSGFEKNTDEVDPQDYGLPEINSSVIVERIVSFAIGCMMGRFSLESKGVVYADSNEEKGNSSSFELIKTTSNFSVDEDGIIPITGIEWFPDDAANRLHEFLMSVWPKDRLGENVDFVANSLCNSSMKAKQNESTSDTIRRYLSTQFYKDHLKTYKKRPIYWLFSSGKQKAFECLVYLHRYNEGTLARMRTEYVIPLTAKMAAYAQKLENDKEASGSAAEVKRLEKEIAQLHKQQAELSEFDEKLRHYADQRISLDLDDGVKVNYGKFGDLLAEVKAITGEAPEALS
ncbi:BREX-1 system adenine-specific DNA-methyltransferase PglX [Vibrio tubiashii]|uniref:site-specific DNA-methyltransferase (adenine-specific) n=1 Tax=Vibrio tubiashii ATCC 19109 TaxID=1051646 RepID=F9TDN8_9VIBR|nr:BREX-1 system adenine-specific DNA-methyltransferase PglX [Vibrio tubiashii]AIW17364.1 Type II restriction enzyme [Vibrio tubiashii ATCC 19109]EGU46869.1 hypothetical protein VITU9109_10767 [Vibrio tubiashii ATCC 19109]